MKKVIVVILALALALSLAACGKGNPEETTAADAPEVSTTEAENETEAVTDDAETTEGEDEAEFPFLTYDEYIEAAIDAPVDIVANVLACQDAYEAYGNVTLYLQNESGAFFAYRAVPASEEDYAALKTGAQVEVKGYKAEWSGEIEIAEGCTFTVLDSDFGYTAEPLDVTDIFADEAELIKNQNKFATVKGLTVAGKGDEGAAFFYGWDGSGEDGSDLYFDLTDGENTFTFVVETDLMDAESEVYAAVKALNVGDTVDVEGFLYWYEGVQMHTTSVTVE